MPTIKWGTSTQAITHGEIREFEQGDLFGDISTNSSERIPNGTRVEIVAETKRWSVAVVRGDITESVGRYQVVGRPEWDTSLPARGYRSSSSVLLKTVLSDINREALGSNWPSLVVMPPDATIGAHYERPAATASEAVRLLEIPCYVRNDGVTVFGTRPTGAVTTNERVLVEYRNDAIGYRVVNCEDPGAFVPGLTFEGETIGEVTFALSADDIKMHVWTRKASTSFSDALRAVWRRLFPRAELQGLYEYVVAGNSLNGKHDLRSIGSKWLPDVKLAPFWTGAAGHRASLTVGTRVGIQFMDASPAKPRLVCVEPIMSTETAWAHAPDTSIFYANNLFNVDAGDTVAVGGSANSVNLGAAAASVVRSGDMVVLVGALVPGGPNTVQLVLSPFDPLSDPPIVPSPPTRVKA